MGQRWMVPRIVHDEDPVYTINCSTEPNVEIEFHYASSSYARLAQVTFLKDVFIKVIQNML